METIIGIIFGIYFVYIQEQWFFKRTNEHYCRMNNGDCSKCICWSCERYVILNEMKNKNEK